MKNEGENDGERRHLEEEQSCAILIKHSITERGHNNSLAHRRNLPLAYTIMDERQTVSLNSETICVLELKLREDTGEQTKA